MPDTYHKDPQAVARLTQAQYQVTQEKVPPSRRSATSTGTTRSPASTWMSCPASRCSPP